MDQLPPGALAVYSRLPKSVQGRVQQMLIKAMQDPYVPALASIPLTYFLAYVPHFLKLSILLPQDGIHYNNETPRTTDLNKYRLAAMLHRLKSAHINVMEGFPAFAAAVLMARIQKVDPLLLTKHCYRYLAARAAYVAVYALGVHRLIALVRTILWAFAQGELAAIFGQCV